MATPRVRFAPSPTGYLHIGGVRTALFNWLWARKMGGAFVLRIEDTDQERSTPASCQVILDSLRWVGIDWDEGPEVGGPHGPYTQMERLALYKEQADKLVSEGKAFRCYKTKDELDAARAAVQEKDPKAEFRYPKEWRDQAEQPGAPHVVRLKVPSEGNVTYVDKVFGEVTTPCSAQQDFVLLRSDGVPLYNFGAVVDDITMGITLVARGRDHMVNTPPQILLYEALGKTPPDFAHLPMMLNQKGLKLSKRDGAVGVFEYRDKGYTPDAVLNYLVRFGWSHGDQEVFSKAELVQAFDWEHCGRGDGKFDEKKFLAIQHEHLKSPVLVPSAHYVEGVRPFLVARGLTPDGEKVESALTMIRERARTFAEAAEAMDYFFREVPVLDAKAASKFLVPENADVLRGLAEAIGSAEPFTAKAIEEKMHTFMAERTLEIKHVAQPARVALTGRSASPGLYEVMELLGKEASVARLLAAAKAAG